MRRRVKGQNGKQKDRPPEIIGRTVITIRGTTYIMSEKDTSLSPHILIKTCLLQAADNRKDAVSQGACDHKIRGRGMSAISAPDRGTHMTEIGLNAPERHSLPKPYKRLFRCAAPKCYSRKHYRGFPAFPALFGHAFALLLFITAFEKL